MKFETRNLGAIYLLSILIGVILLSFMHANALGETSQFIEIPPPEHVIIKDWGLSITKVSLIDHNCISPTDCYAILEYDNYRTITPTHKSLVTENYDWDFYSQFQKINMNYRFEILETKTEQIEFTNEDLCNNEELPNGTIIEICNTTYRLENITTNKWIPLDYFNSEIPTGKNLIKVWAKRPANTKIEFIPNIHNIEIGQWAWWNTSMNYRRNITNNTADYNVAVAINGTNGFGADSTIIWYNPAKSPEAFLYYQNTSYYAVGNETTAQYFETEGVKGLPNYSISDVYSQYAIAVWHLSDNTSSTVVEESIANYDGVASVNTDTRDKQAVFAGGFHANKSAWIDTTNANFETQFSNALTNKFTVIGWFKNDDNAWEGSQYVFGTYKDDDNKVEIYMASSGKFYFGFKGGGTGCFNQATGAWINTSTWHMFALTMDDSGNAIDCYVDGVSECDAVCNADFSGTVDHTVIGAEGDTPGNFEWDGILDEFRIYNTTLTQTQIQALYYDSININNRLGAEEEYITGNFSLLLNSPANNYNTGSQDILFNCTASDTTAASNITNITLQIWYSNDTIYYENTTSGLNQENYTLAETVTNIQEHLNYKWNCLAYNTLGNSTTGSANRTFSIDITEPFINIINPKGNKYTFGWPSNRSIDYIVTDAGLGVSSCWFELDSNGTNISLAGCANTSININSGYDHNLTIYSNDTVGNIGQNISYFTTNSVNHTHTYLSHAVETQNTTFKLYLNATNLDNATAFLIWNSTNYGYDIAVTGGNTANFTKYLAIPEINANINITFYWNYTINSEFYNKTINQTQELTDTVVNISATCPVGCKEAKKFKFFDEKSVSTGILEDIDYFITYGVLGNVTGNGSITKHKELSLCISPVWANLSVFDDQFRYYNTTFSTRSYYLFTSDRLDNKSETLLVYNLLKTNASAFALTITDVSGALYDDTLIGLLRWYPELNEYKLVEMERTSDEAQTVVYVEQETVDYRVAVYDDDGTLIYTTNPFRFVCYSTPCTADITVYPADIDYFTEWDISGSIDLNDDTDTFTYAYSGNNDGATLNLSVFRLTGSGRTLLCSDTSTAISTVLSCEHSNISGVYKAEVYYSNSPLIPIASMFADATTNFANSTLGLILVIFISIVLAIIGNWSPYIALISTVGGLAFGFMLGAIPMAVVFGVAALAILIMLVLKKAV